MLTLNVTRDLGVNLAGVEIILNMREKMDEMQREFETFIASLRDHIQDFKPDQPPPEAGALIPVKRMAERSTLDFINFTMLKTLL
jgi:MerR family transcriptional regulator/heat shock protein HspR